MKKTILMIAGLVATVSMMAQGNLAFGNKATGVNAPVTDRLTGEKIAGADYVAMLYWGAAGTDPAAFTPVVDNATGALVAALPFRTGSAAGYIVTTAVSVKGAAAGQEIWVQMRAWSAVGGATYEAAYAAATTGGMAATVKLGASNFFPVTPNAPPSTPQVLAGLQAFTVDYIPEPSVLALGLLGGVEFLLRRRS
jgi:hypothetical protein